MNSSNENSSLHLVYDDLDMDEDYIPTQESYASSSFLSNDESDDMDLAIESTVHVASAPKGKFHVLPRMSTAKAAKPAYNLNKSAPAATVTCRSDHGTRPVPCSPIAYSNKQDNTVLISYMQRMETNLGLLDKRVKYLAALVEKGQKDTVSQLKEVKNRVDILQQSSKSKGQEKLYVPSHIKSAVHDGYRSGVEEKNYKWVTKDGDRMMKAKSEENKEMSKYIRNFVKGLYSETDDGVIQAAIDIYFCTLKQREQKERDGKVLTHKKTMLLYSRKARKLKWRKAALKQKRGWEEERKNKVMESLLMDFMSSEEELDSEDDSVFRTKPLQWRSEEYDYICKELDAKHLKMQSARSKRQMVKRIRGTVQSVRSKPNNMDCKHNWVFK